MMLEILKLVILVFGFVTFKYRCLVYISHEPVMSSYQIPCPLFFDLESQQGRPHRLVSTQNFVNWLKAASMV